MTTDSEAANRLRRAADGFWCALGAYTLWGLFPLYFKSVSNIPAGEMLAQRAVCSLLILTVCMTCCGWWQPLWEALRRPRVIKLLICSAALIASNWLAFLIAVNSNRVLEASFGYFITPLASVLLGCVVLKERLRRLQLVGLALAMLGVLILAVAGRLPVLALLLAVTFSLYGLVRKVVAIDALLGLYVETTLMLPFALGYLFYLVSIGRLEVQGVSLTVQGLVMLSGPVTMVPLVLFAAAAQRLPLSQLGMWQYFSPCLQFLLAVLVFGEPFTTTEVLSFACVWLALGVFAFETHQLSRARAAAQS